MLTWLVVCVTEYEELADESNGNNSLSSEGAQRPLKVSSSDSEEDNVPSTENTQLGVQNKNSTKKNNNPEGKENNGSELRDVYEAGIGKNLGDVVERIQQIEKVRKSTREQENGKNEPEWIAKQRKSKTYVILCNTGEGLLTPFLS